MTNINKGTLSRFLNKNSDYILSIKQLIPLTEALGLNRDYFCNEYLQALFSEKEHARKSDWRQISKFIEWCLEEEEQSGLHFIQLTLVKLLEECESIASIKSLVAKVFNETEELLLSTDNNISTSTKQLMPLYQFVIDNESNSHSEYISVSQYRIFKLKVANDETTKLERYDYCFTFAVYRSRLPRHIALDALMELSTQFYYLGDWQESEKYAHELIQMANEEYHYQVKKLKDGDVIDIGSERSFVKYYGQGYLLKSVSLEKQKRFDDALYYVQFYRDLSHLKGIDDEGEKEVRRFTKFAEANFYLLSVLKGNQSILEEYVEFLKRNPYEVPIGITAILTAANSYNWLIDEELKEFNLLNEAKEFQNEASYYALNVYKTEYADFLYHMAKYMSKHKRFYFAIENALHCLDLAIRFTDRQRILNLVALCFRLQSKFDESQAKRYEQLIKGVNDDEEIDGLSTDHF